jgi:cyanophycinase
VPAEVLDLKTREDTDDPRLLEKLEGASAVYFSGGNPAYLAATLADSDFLDAMLKQLDRGMAYAGCSAGVACLNEITFDSDTTEMSEVWKPGLGLVQKALFAPHWDIVDTWIPGASDFILASVPDGATFIGMDEDTAMMGNGSDWEVLGRGGMHVRRGDEAESYLGGDRFVLALI